MDERKKRRISVNLTWSFLEALDRLVNEGVYVNHQDAVREALMRLFRFHGIEQLSQNGSRDRRARVRNARTSVVDIFDERHL